MPRNDLRRTALLACLLAAPAGGSAAAAPRGDDSCRGQPPRQDRLVALGARGELVLASGARAVLSDLRWPEDAAVAEAARAWLLGYREVPLTLGVRGSGEDRWGRLHADILAGAEDTDLAGGLIRDGLARADAGESDALCRPALLMLETAPRAAGLGVWAEPVRAAGDGTALAALDGRFVVAEGRIVSVGERTARTYLNFVRRGESGLTVSVPKRTWRTMAERGFTGDTLRGRLVRVRGTIELDRGPALEIRSADMIEVLEGERAPRR